MTVLLERRQWLNRGGFAVAGAALGWLGARGFRDPTPRALGEEDEDGPEERLKKLKLELPAPPVLKGATLVPAVRSGNMLYVSGHIPYKDGKPIVGKVGKEVKLKD